MTGVEIEKLCVEVERNARISLWNSSCLHVLDEHEVFFSSIPYKLLNGLSFLLDTKIKRIIFGPLRDTIVTTLNFTIGGLKFESPEMEIYGLGENLTLFYDSKRREGRGY